MKKLALLLCLFLFSSCFSTGEPNVIRLEILDKYDGNIFLESGNLKVLEVPESNINKNCEVSEGKLRNCVTKTITDKSVNDVYSHLEEREFFLQPNKRYIFKVESFSTKKNAATSGAVLITYTGGIRKVTVIVE